MNFHHVIELAASVAGLYFLLINRLTKFYRFLLIYVIIAFFIDFSGFLILKYLEIYNGWLYNIYDIIKYPLLIYLFMLISTLSKKVFWAFYIVYFIFVVLDIFNLSTINDLLSYSTVAADLLLIFLSLHFYYSILKNPEFKSLHLHPYFWFANGVLFYFLCMLPYHVFWTPLAIDNIDYDRRFYQVIADIAIFLHYCCFSITFYICRFHSNK